MTPVQNDWASRIRVGIIGGNHPNKKALADAELMGRLIAENRYILVNGGMKGVMEASARGAKAADGFVMSILPGKSFTEGNAYTDLAIPTGIGYLRNAMVVLNAHVLVAIDGSYGTLSEIAYAKIYERTVFGLGTWDIQGVIPLGSPEEVMQHINQLFK